MPAGRKPHPLHPHVVICKPVSARRIHWRLRYRNPDAKGKFHNLTIPHEHDTPEKRTAFAVEFSKQLAERRAGKLPPNPVLDERVAIARYLVNQGLQAVARAILRGVHLPPKAKPLPFPEADKSGHSSEPGRSEGDALT